MTMTRRQIVVGGGLGGAALVAGAAPAAVPTGPKVHHHVLFWLKNAGSAADREALIAGLRTLAQIPVVRSLTLGVPASTAQRDVIDSSFDVSELMLFDSSADQDIYQAHPLHQRFIADFSPLWRKVLVYDVATL
jgi:hypothetical protein